MHGPDEHEAMTVREAAEYLAVTAQHVHNLITAGELSSTKVEGRRFVSRAACRAYRGPERLANKRARAKERRAERMRLARDRSAELRGEAEQRLRDLGHEPYVPTER